MIPILKVTDLMVHLPAPRGTVRAVDGVSLSLIPGRTLAVVGESGSGKSMLGRTVMGLLPRNAVISRGGSIQFAGTELTGLPPGALRRITGRDMAMVFQDPMTSLNPLMRVGRQVTEGLRHHLGISAREAAERAVQLLGEVGIGNPRHRSRQYPHALSGGQRQRVAIAIALSCSPRLIIADEPTTALDVTVQADILDLLARLQEEKRMGMILISHDLGVVAGRAHETAVMYAGRLVETGPTRQIFDAPRMHYTRALLAAIPRLTDPPGTHLAAIGGSPPDLAAPPSGCAFSPRCPRADDPCRNVPPPLRGEPDSGHRWACWHPYSGTEAVH